MVRRIVILVQGRTCAGKSTLVGVLSKALAGTVKDLYVLPYDLIKTGIMGYRRDKHAPLVKQLAVGISEVMFSKQLSVLVDMNFGSKYEYDRYVRAARRCRYEVVPINLVAPRNVLLERFRRRIRAFRTEGRDVSGMDEWRYLKALRKRGYLAKHSYSFDTSEKNVDEISREVVGILRSLSAVRPCSSDDVVSSNSGGHGRRSRARAIDGRAIASSTLALDCRQADVNAGESHAGT